MPEPEADAPLPEAPTGPRCCHLRSKGMYVFNDAEADEDPYAESGSTAYWCLKTMTSFGPDDEPAAGPDCRNPSRSCYEPT